MNQIIFISGTPCVGKTTVASVVSNNLNAKLIKINQLAIENDLVLGIDSEKGYKIIDIDKLDSLLQDIINNLDSDKLLIVEGHLSHLCSNADKVIILRLHPNVLEKRLASRNYSESKIRENLEAEALDVCGQEAYETYFDKVAEIDVTNLAVDEIAMLIEDVIFNQKNTSFSEIDFMDWLINL